jgi:hypothetical protein
VVEPPRWTLIIVSPCALLTAVALIGMTFTAGPMPMLPPGKVIPAPLGVASIVAFTLLPSSVLWLSGHRECAPVVRCYEEAIACTVAVDANDYSHGPLLSGSGKQDATPQLPARLVLKPLKMKSRLPIGDGAWANL